VTFGARNPVFETEQSPTDSYKEADRTLLRALAPAGCREIKSFGPDMIEQNVSTSVLLPERPRNETNILDPTTLVRLCYVSTATLGSDREPTEEIESILERSRWWNASVGITGSLFFNRSLFSQVLEGPVREVERLFEQIRKDPRHQNVIRIDWRMIETRTFPEWSMAFVGAEEAERGRFHHFLLDERRAAIMASDAMLGLLVNIVRHREAGHTAPTEIDRAVAAVSAVSA
jgi:hypothetical protein